MSLGTEKKIDGSGYIYNFTDTSIYLVFKRKQKKECWPSFFLNSLHKYLYLMKRDIP